MLIAYYIFSVETLLILITATALNMREHVGAFSGTRRNETEPSTQEELSFIDKHQQKQSDQKYHNSHLPK